MKIFGAGGGVRLLIRPVARLRPLSVMFQERGHVSASLWTRSSRRSWRPRPVDSSSHFLAGAFGPAKMNFQGRLGNPLMGPHLKTDGQDLW